MFRRATVLALWATVALSPVAQAAQPQCTLDVATCLNMFAHGRERPWIGVEFEADSTGAPHVQNVLPDSPAAKAGVKPGDVIEGIGGKTPQEWFAGKSGWETGGEMAISVRRGGKERQLKCEVRPVSDEMFARIIGIHIIEGHFAHAGSATPENH